MKNKPFNIKHLGILLTTILTLSLFASNLLIVQADVGGTGKFLTINFGDATNSNCYVNATKISSDHVFTFLANLPKTNSQKVGAGTVILEAYPDTDNGWEFKHFLIGDTEIRLNGTEYKTEKLDTVYAVFEIATFDIEVSIVDGLGEIYLGENIVISCYDVAELPKSVIQSVTSGSTPMFEFVPLSDPETYHVSAVLVNETSYVDLVLTEFTQSYQFPVITEDGHSLAVTFSLDGQAYIPTGSGVTVFLSSAASLTFSTVNEGSAAGHTLTPVIDGDIIVWTITVDAAFSDVIIGLLYPEGLDPQTILTCNDPDFVLFLKSDLNNDGIVNGQDVKIIANVVKHDKFLPDNDDPLYAVFDVNDDTHINEEDVHAVNSLTGVEYSDFEWEPLDNISVDIINHIISGETDHFSVFRCR